MKLRIVFLVGLTVLLSGSVAHAWIAGANMGDAWTTAIHAWLPHFGAAQEHQVYDAARPTITGKTDFYVCPDAPQNASVSVRSFKTAASGCPRFQSGKDARLEVMGMDHGWVFYDTAHDIVFFSRGCCSVGSYILTSGVGPPPKPITEADLTVVRTHRGVSLGMSAADVTAIYGRGIARPLSGAPGSAFLSYSSGQILPPSGCDQKQIFAFKSDRLYYIELQMGC